MTTDDLREKYGSPVHHTTPDDEEYFTDDYVLWLEKQLLNRYNLQSEDVIERAIRSYRNSKESYLKMEVVF